MSLIPITCGSCKKSFASFNADSGCIVDNQGNQIHTIGTTDIKAKVFGAYLPCECGKFVKFDGARARKKLLALAAARKYSGG